jgi:hypothetical protein
MQVTKKESNNSEPIAIQKQKKKGNVCKKTHSNFFLTINSQKRLNSLDEPSSRETKEKFSEAVDDFFNNKIMDFIVFDHSKSADEYYPKSTDREELKSRLILGDCKVEYVIEIGPQTSCLHSHGLVALAKRGVNTKLDYKKIKEYFDQKLGYPVHFNSRVYTDSKANLQSYIEKTLN